MKISIVTTSLNQSRYVPEMLESVRAQEYPDLEHLIFDARSTDGTVALLESTLKDPQWRHVHWWSEADSGQSEAMNKGFRRATGDIVGWLNSDDRYCPGAFHRVARFFDENPDVDVVYGDYTFMNASGALITKRREIAFNGFTLLHHRVSFIHSTATFFRRRIFEEGNFLDESLHLAMDYEFYLRLAAKGYRFQHLSAILADFRFHDESKSYKHTSMQMKEMRTIRRGFSRASRLRPDLLREAVFTLLQTAAGLMRYSEKFIRGYYWGQRNPKWLDT